MGAISIPSIPTQQQIADHLDLSQGEVSRLLDELAIDWRDTAMDTIRVAYIRKLRAMAAGHRSSSGDDLVQERVLNERLDRQMKELQLAEKRGQLVNVAELEPMLVQMVVAFRTDLTTRDDKLKSAIDALHGLDVDLQLFNDHTHDALLQLARYDPERAGFDAPGDRADAPGAEDVHDGVGAPAPAAEPEGDGAAGSLLLGADALGAADPQGT